jgi:putative phosphoesterase
LKLLRLRIFSVEPFQMLISLNLRAILRKSSLLPLAETLPPLPPGWRRAGLISDTHNHLRPAVFRLLEGCAAILHSGDLTSGQVLMELQAIAPVHAIAGNCDVGETRSLGLWKRIDFPFGAVVVTHGHLFRPDRLEDELLREFGQQENLRIIMHGHTHWPRLTPTDRGVWIVNPGSASEPRGRSEASLAVLDYDSAGDSKRFQITHIRVP